MYTAEKEEIDIQHAPNGGEKRVGKYFLDGYHENTPITPLNFRDVFGTVARDVRRDTMNSVNGKTKHELHQITMEKTEFLKKEGYDVVEVWECDIKRKMDEGMKHYFDHFPVADPLEPRDALYESKLFHRWEGDERIK